MNIQKSYSKDKIPLFYWSEIKFIFKDKENYGDLLSKYLVENISGKRVKWVQPKKQGWYKRDKTNYLAIGSILSHASKKSIVWGSGIIDCEHLIERADFRAVRGPRTHEFLSKQGFDCPEVYGDPALLLPRYFTSNDKKKFEVGIIPHYNDYKKVKEAYKNDGSIKVIDLMTLDVEETTREILSCEQTISSSLHGLIVSHAYNIPSIWVEFSDKIFGDGVKYPDYLESLDIPVYQPPFLEARRPSEELKELIRSFPNLPEQEKLKEVQHKLIEACPFKGSEVLSEDQKSNISD